MSKVLTEVATQTASVVVPEPGDDVLAGDLEIAAQSLANRSRVFSELGRILNWGSGYALSVNDYEPIAVGYDSGRTRRWYVLHNDPAAGPPEEWAVSSSADGITWTVEEHLQTTQLRTLCTGSVLDDSILVGGASSNIVQRVGLSPTWTTRAVPNLADCWDIAWDETNGLFIAVGERSDSGGGDPGAWTSPDGTTWTQRTISDPVGVSEAQNVVVSSTGHAVAWSGDQYWTSSDGGVTWIDRGTAPASISDLAVTDDGKTWMMMSGTAAYLSTDNGVTWGSVLSAEPSVDNDVAALAAVGNTFVGISPFSGTSDTTDHVGELVYSVDLGVSWHAAAPVDRLKLNWPGGTPGRRQLYKTREGQLAVLGCDNTVASDLYLFKSLALKAAGATA